MLTTPTSSAPVTGPVQPVAYVPVHPGTSLQNTAAAHPAGTVLQLDRGATYLEAPQFFKAVTIQAVGTGPMPKIMGDVTFYGWPGGGVTGVRAGRAEMDGIDIRGNVRFLDSWDFIALWDCRIEGGGFSYEVANLAWPVARYIGMSNCGIFDAPGEAVLIGRCAKVSIDRCAFDRPGGGSTADPTRLHALYLNESLNGFATVTNCIITNAPNLGIRGATVAQGNFVCGCGFGISSGCASSVQDNCVIRGRGIPGSAPNPCGGLDIHSHGPVWIEGNIVANGDPASGACNGVTLGCDGDLFYHRNIMYKFGYSGWAFHMLRRPTRQGANWSIMDSDITAHAPQALIQDDAAGQPRDAVKFYRMRSNYSSDWWTDAPGTVVYPNPDVDPYSDAIAAELRATEPSKWRAGIMAPALCAAVRSGFGWSG